MEKLTKVVVNCETGENLIVELTDEETAQLELDRAQSLADRIAREEAEKALAALKASAKAKLVAGEPLTPEEAATIVL